MCCNIGKRVGSGAMEVVSESLF